ncbi:hypothetical protein DL96DRAFT_1615814 [Flagelloscypha sp. PMI_526]|nr:hypothetical protein DL96DRAFT_1615814 [Flagelloscypha sp. PMI_526]
MSSATNSSPPRSTGIIMPMTWEEQYAEEEIDVRVTLRVPRVPPKYFNAIKDALKHSHRSQFSEEIADIPDWYEMNSGSDFWEDIYRLREVLRVCEEAEEEFNELRDMVESYNSLPVAPSPGHLLPLDVLREIFTLIPHDASLVSKETQRRLDPILFQKVVIRDGSKLLAALQGRAVPPSPRLIRASTIVKKISVAPNRTFDELWGDEEWFPRPINPLSSDVWKGITEICPNIQTISLCFKDYEVDQIPRYDGRALPNLRRLHCEPRYFLAPTDTHILSPHIYQTITHLSLNLRGHSEIIRQWVWTDLQRLESLVALLIQMPEIESVEIRLIRLAEKVISGIMNPQLTALIFLFVGARLSTSAVINHIRTLDTRLHDQIVCWVTSNRVGHSSMGQTEDGVLGGFEEYENEFWDKDFLSHLFEFMERRKGVW